MIIAWHKRRRLVPALLVLGAVAGSAGGTATAQQSGYSTWRPPDGETGETRLQSMIERLGRLVDAAERARAADPNFLRDLRALARDYATAGPATGFRDDFADGDFSRDPVWTVSAGKYWVERGWGLRSAVDPSAATGEAQELSEKQRAARLFGAILNQALGGKQGGDRETATGAGAAAVINADAAIANAFRLGIEMSSWSAAGRIEFALYQGRFEGAGSPGYRLAYQPGGGFELLRVSNRGTVVVERGAGAHPLENKKVHRIEWTRMADGRMRVSVDGGAVIDAVDQGFRDAFSGIALINRGGDYIVKGIEIVGGR